MASSAPVPAYLQGFETLDTAGIIDIPNLFQHTYKGSKPRYGSLQEIASSRSSIPTRVRNVMLNDDCGATTKVPAYLQGFETPIQLIDVVLTKSVPAYLQGFETYRPSFLAITASEFQHTYKGSKLGALLALVAYDLLFQHTYKGSKRRGQRSNEQTRPVPAYLQGFETS